VLLIWKEAILHNKIKYIQKDVICLRYLRNQTRTAMELKKGISVTKSIIVQDKDSAKSLGSGGLNVFGTPAMLALMENAALEMVRPYLPEGSDTVGTSASIKHLKVSPIGAAISCTATLTDVNGPKLDFTIECFDEAGDLIGSARHGRFVVDVARFMAKIC